MFRKYYSLEQNDILYDIYIFDILVQFEIIWYEQCLDRNGKMIYGHFWISTVGYYHIFMIT